MPSGSQRATCPKAAAHPSPRLRRASRLQQSKAFGICSHEKFNPPPLDSPEEIEDQHEEPFYCGGYAEEDKRAKAPQSYRGEAEGEILIRLPMIFHGWKNEWRSKVTTT